MASMADLASYLDIPIFSWVSNMPELDDKVTKSTLVRAVAPISSLSDILLFFCAKMNWYKLAMISTADEKSMSMSGFYRSKLKDNGNDFRLTRDFNMVDVIAKEEDIKFLYSEIKKEARVIVLVIPIAQLRRYLVIADKMGMAGGDYQFLFTERTIPNEQLYLTLKSVAFWQRGDQDDKHAQRGFHSLLYFSYPSMIFWLEDAGTDAAQRVFGSDPDIPKAAATPDRFAKFLYDSFYLYALAFNQSMSNSSSVPTGRSIFQNSCDQRFMGKSGRFLTDNKADRRGSYYIWDMGEDSIFRKVFVAKYDTIQKTLQLDVMGNILWGNSRKYLTSKGTYYVPPDTPPCGFSNEHCQQDYLATELTATLIVLVMLAAVIAFLVIFRWWRKERALYETHWKVKYSVLDFDVSRGPLSQHNMITESQTSGHVMEQQDGSDDQSYSSASTSLARRDNMLMIAQMFTLVARYRGDLVSVRKINKKSIKEDKNLLREMQMMKALKHTNLATFYGACTEAPHVCVLWEYCSKGSLQDVLNNSDIRLEALFQFSIAVDIATGLHYLHNSELGVHGNLRASNCVIDSRWVAKLTDFGLRRFRRGEKRGEGVSDDKYYSDLLWTAPEVLRSVLKSAAPVMTKEADIYSLGIVLKQVLCKNSAYSDELVVYTSQEIVNKVAHPLETTPGAVMRPHIPEEFPEQTILMLCFKRLIASCWHEDPTTRPNIKRVASKMKKISPLRSSSVLDNMLALMERYSTRLEDLVSERTLQLEEEKRKTDMLLYRMLPRKVADDLKRGEHVQAEAFQGVTIYFSDIVGFTTLASESQPMEIVEMLNRLYSHFDDIISEFDVYKVETIGDAYMVVSGCPTVNESHASVMARAALSLLDSVLTFVIPHRPEEQLRIRIGLNSGPVVAGVVGNTMPRYCLFGNTVNLASRMESQGLPLRIQASSFTYDLIKDNEEFKLEARGSVEIKGKGLMTTYWLTRQANQALAAEDNSPALQSPPKSTAGSWGDLRNRQDDRQTGHGKSPVLVGVKGAGDCIVTEKSVTNLDLTRDQQV
ncbi:hypothetical protein RRG08_011981 [Elysia crispata]|uniref:Guanylate cyclase n=1 Tax=Elysia crispata TaxID=231223 RepID=A0AAE0ZH61_9GAST|nr:hypothetical protein RRG08_011981 [Elysia crispata]